MCLYDTCAKKFVGVSRLKGSTSEVEAGPKAPDDGGPGWDCRLDSVTVLAGGFFSTGYVPKFSPKVTMRYKLSGRLYTDIFGTTTRQEGCFILNNSDGTLYHRYGTQSNTPLPSGYSDAGVTYDLVADASVYVNGKNIGKVGQTGNFSKNNEPMEVPGRAYPGNSPLYKTAVETIYSFQLEDNGALRVNLIPCLKDGKACVFNTCTDEFIPMSALSGCATEAIPGKVVADDGSPIPQRWHWRGATGASWNDANNWTNQFGFVKTDGGLIAGDIAIFDGPAMTVAAGAVVDGLAGLEIFGEVELSGVRRMTGEGLTLGENAKLTLPADAAIGFQTAKVGETAIEPGLYTEAAWLSGGRVKVGDLPWSQVPWDYRAQYVTIPKGGYFATGFVPKNQPRADIRFCVPDSSATIDLFGAPSRIDGCFILNMDKGPLYYRYGTTSHAGAVSMLESRRVYEIACDADLAIDGEVAQTVRPANFEANTQSVDIPGRQYLGEESIYGVSFVDGGVKVRDYIPCVKDGKACLYEACTATFLELSGTGEAVAGPSVTDDGGTEVWCWRGESGAAWSEPANWTNANGRVCTIPGGPASASDVVIVADRPVLIGVDGDCRAATLSIVGEGTVAFTGTGVLMAAALILDEGVSLALSEGFALGACTVRHGDETLGRDIYTGEGRGTTLDWISGAGQLRNAGTEGGIIPEIIPTPAADGVYEFGRADGSYGVGKGYSGRPESDFHWIVAEFPTWEKYVFPAEAKLRIKGYLILDTIPAGWFSEVDTSEAKYIELHTPLAFADGSKLVVPSDCWFRFQPGDWVLDGGKYWLLNERSETVQNDLEVNGKVGIYGDNAHLKVQTFEGQFLGQGVEFWVHNFGNQGRFRGGMGFTGYSEVFQNGDLLWFDTLAITGRFTSVVFSGCLGQFATNAQYSANGFLFGRDGSDETADHELVIDKLQGNGNDVVDPKGKRWRTGGQIIVWGNNTVHVGELVNGLHVMARRQDQDCNFAFFASANCKGNGNLVVDKFVSGSLYLSTNINVRVGEVASTSATFDYTYQKGAVNMRTLDITGDCDVWSKVKATDLAMLPARITGFKGDVVLTDTGAKTYPVTVDVSKGTDGEVYNRGGCAGSGNLDVAPAEGTINLTIDGGENLVKGRYGIARFTSGGERLRGWTVNVVSAKGLIDNGDGTYAGPGGMDVSIRRDDSGIWLRVNKPGLKLIVR